MEPAVFWRAQERMNSWTTRISNETALVKLRQLLDREGGLSAALIYATPGMPHPEFYRSRFGGLTRAYALVGFTPKRDYRFLRGYGLRRRQLAELRDRIAGDLGGRGLTVEREGVVMLRVGGRLSLGVSYAHYRPIKGAVRWFGQYHGERPQDWMLFGLLNEGRSMVMGYCLISGGITNFWLGGRHYTPGLEEWYEDSLAPLLDRVAGFAREGYTGAARPIRRARPKKHGVV